MKQKIKSEQNNLIKIEGKEAWLKRDAFSVFGVAKKAENSYGVIAQAGLYNYLLKELPDYKKAVKFMKAFADGTVSVDRCIRIDIREDKARGIN